MTDEPIEVPVAGGTLAIRQRGAPVGSGAPVVLAAHGITGNHVAWAPVQRHLGTSSRSSPTIYADEVAATESRDPSGWRRTATTSAPCSTTSASSVRSSSATRWARTSWRGSPPIIRSACKGSSWSTAASAAPSPRTSTSKPHSKRCSVPRSHVSARRSHHVTSTTTSGDAHPAFGNGDVDDDDLAAYADHDLMGEPPAMRSSVQRGCRASGRRGHVHRRQCGEPAHGRHRAASARLAACSTSRRR